MLEVVDHANLIQNFMEKDNLANNKLLALIKKSYSKLEMKTIK